MVLKGGHGATEDVRTALVEQIRGHVRDLAKHLAPRARHIAIVDELPKVEAGKIRRNELRRVAREDAKAAVDHQL